MTAPPWAPGGAELGALTWEDADPEADESGSDAPGDENLCTDFEYAVPGPLGTLLSVHRQDTLVLSALRDWSPAR